jgi:hypothetical protein
MKGDEGKHIGPWLLSGILLAPSALWIAKDRSVWSWDPSFYAMDSTDLWYVLTHHPTRWPERMIAIFQAKAPGIAWLGQFFVPLGRWMGSVELGLMMSILLCQFVTLLLIFAIGRRVAPGPIGPALGGTLLVAGGPLFVGMSHLYLTEALQLTAIAYVLWISVEAETSPPLRVLLHLILAGVVGLLAKVTTPVYVIFPAAWAIFHAAVRFRRGKDPLHVGWGEFGLAASVAVVGGAAFFWYLRNGKHVYQFALLAASSDMALAYGQRAPFFTKLGTWVGAMSRVLFTQPVAWFLLAFGAAAPLIILVRSRPRLEVLPPKPGASRLFVLGMVAQVLLVLAFLGTTVNEETRYLLPLSPFFAVLAVSAVAALGDRRTAVAVCLILGSQWAVVNSRQLGWLPPEEGASWWSGPPQSDAGRIRDVAAAVRATCDDRSVGRWSTVGVDFAWLNHYTLMFYATKDQFDHPGRCYYQYLGHAPKDPVEAMRLVQAMDGAYFISLELPAMPKPPDFLNVISAEVTRRVEGDSTFERVPFTSSSGISLHRRR